MPRTLAVFGGSFNPPHVAHLMVCVWVLETQPVDELVVVPTFRHPFDKQLAPFADRAAMCRLLVRGLGPRAQVSTVEEEIGGEVSRTLDTLELLARRLPDRALRLVIGADILRERDKWYRWPDIERLAPPIVVGRPGFPGPDGTPELASVSSTDVRARLGRGASVAGLVPRAIVEYIAARGLYP